MEEEYSVTKGSGGGGVIARPTTESPVSSAPIFTFPSSPKCLMSNFSVFIYDLVFYSMALYTRKHMSGKVFTHL